jgi:hypothetical protein
VEDVVVVVVVIEGYCEIFVVLVCNLSQSAPRPTEKSVVAKEEQWNGRISYTPTPPHPPDTSFPHLPELKSPIASRTLIVYLSK